MKLWCVDRNDGPCTVDAVAVYRGDSLCREHYLQRLERERVLAVTGLPAAASDPKET